jgi:hypothetical protein
MKISTRRHYRPTESKYKGGANDMFVTYDLPQMTRSGRSAMVPKVKRVYIAGDVNDVSTGSMLKRSGRRVRGVRIGYCQTREGYSRREFVAHREGRAHPVSAALVKPAKQKFTEVVEVPEKARNVHFYRSRELLPERYAHALQRVR